MTRLLVGLGNADRGDDGVGIAVVRRVAPFAGNVEVVECDDPASLINTWAEAELVVVVDAIRSGRTAGDVLTLDVTETPLPADGWARGGTHNLGLAAAVELSRALGRMPQRLVVVGVEAGEMTTGTEFSAPAQAAVQPAADAVMRALGDMR